MSKLIADESLAHKLPHLIQPVDLCDASGQVLGRYFPYLDPMQFQLQPQISDEELQRRKNATHRTYSTEEVLKHLESL